MATMTVSLAELDRIENTAAKLDLWLNLYRRTNLVARVTIKCIFLTRGLRQIRDEQAQTLQHIKKLEGRTISAANLLDMADKLDHLVSINNSLLSNGRTVGFPAWLKYLDEIEAQTERFDSLAETFREGADESFAEAVKDLVRQADSETAANPGADRRDLVAGLHD